MQTICYRAYRILTLANALLLIYSYAISRGLPRKLTRNLHTPSKYREDWLSSTYGRLAAPRKPTGAPVRAKPKTNPESAWGPVGEVVRMAERRDQLTLGCAPSR